MMHRARNAYPDRRKFALPKPQQTWVLDGMEPMFRRSKKQMRPALVFAQKRGTVGCIVVGGADCGNARVGVPPYAHYSARLERPRTLE